jgi:hypothetical protein
MFGWNVKLWFGLVVVGCEDGSELDRGHREVDMPKRGFSGREVMCDVSCCDLVVIVGLGGGGGVVDGVLKVQV